MRLVRALALVLVVLAATAFAFTLAALAGADDATAAHTAAVGAAALAALNRLFGASPPGLPRGPTSHRAEAA